MGEFQRSSQHLLAGVILAQWKKLSGALPVEPFSWPIVELRGDYFQRFSGVDAQVAVFPKVLPQQSVRVLVGSPLPWFARVGEEHAVVEEGGNLVVVSHFGALVPGQCAPQMLG